MKVKNIRPYNVGHTFKGVFYKFRVGEEKIVPDEWDGIRQIHDFAVMVDVPKKVRKRKATKVLKKTTTPRKKRKYTRKKKTK